MGGGTEAGPVPIRALAMDPPHVVWEGLQRYVQFVALIRVADWQAEQKQREAKRSQQQAPAGVKRISRQG